MPESNNQQTKCQVINLEKENKIWLTILDSHAMNNSHTQIFFAFVLCSPIYVFSIFFSNISTIFYSQINMGGKECPMTATALTDTSVEVTVPVLLGGDYQVLCLVLFSLDAKG